MSHEAGQRAGNADEERPTPICAIGASAGGVKALQAFFERIDSDLGLAYVVIVHLAPDFPSHLSEILASRTTMPVRQVEDSPLLRPNCVYVIGPDRELVIDGNEIRSRPFAEPRGRRAPIDMFFRSAAAGRGDGLAVLLSGEGSDGAAGVLDIKEAGGVVFVQDPREAEYAAMPRAAISTGAADFVAPIGVLVERVKEVSRSKQATQAMDEATAVDELDNVLKFLRVRTGHDFSAYKRATVMRRVLRRLQVTRRESLSAYASYLRETPEEAQALFNDLLISVTMFFRDPAAFDTLAREAIAPLFDRCQPGESVRVWVAGCATGEEAYSVAMLFLEEAERRAIPPAIQVFATDLDDGALATAREGRYPASIAEDVSQARLSRFFVHEGSHYRIRKKVRDLVLFARHSVLKDPPFMRLDMVCCRNLLIYLDRDMQRRVLAIFGYGLKPGGFLFLGTAETADLRPELFENRDREARIYVARPRAGRGVDLLSELPHEHRPHFPPPPPASREEPRDEIPRHSHMTALEAHAPPSVLVDEDFRILHLSRNAGRFLLPSEGPLKPELPDLVRPELRSELRASLHRAVSANEPSQSLPLAVAFDGARRRVTLYVAPVREDRRRAPQVLVMFLDAGPLAADETAEAALTSPDAVREELMATQERLSATRRGYEGAIQELRVANEELQSMNEEYRSTAEELETSKEELQSVNEELQTVNIELKSKLEAIASAHNDLRNLVNATEIGTLFLDPDLRIRMLTPAVEQLFSATDADVGRPITDFTHKLAYDGIEEDARRVLGGLVPIEGEVATRDGRWLMMRLRPYRTTDDRIDGVVVSFVDLTERRRMEARLRDSEERHRLLFETMDEGFLLAEVIRDASGRAVDVHYQNANPAAMRMVGADFTGKRLSQVAPDFEPHWYEIPARVADTGLGERHELFARPLGQWFDLGVSRVDGDLVAIVFKDVTARHRHEKERELLIGELNHRVKNMLAVVQSIAMQTRRSNPDPDQFTEAFARRLRALATAHGLLTDNHWHGSDLGTLAHRILDGFVERVDDRIRFDGPAIPLSPNATISFAMAFHELATNAVKHGALSVPDGKVNVMWSVEPEADGVEARFRLDWVELGGPPAERPDRKGFGLRVLGKGIANEMEGDVSLDFRREGFACRMAFPLRAMTSEA